jgi:hypothetical protein
MDLFVKNNLYFCHQVGLKLIYTRSFYMPHDCGRHYYFEDDSGLEYEFFSRDDDQETFMSQFEMIVNT